MTRFVSFYEGFGKAVCLLYSEDRTEIVSYGRKEDSYTVLKESFPDEYVLDMAYACMAKDVRKARDMFREGLWLFENEGGSENGIKAGELKNCLSEEFSALADKIRESLEEISQAGPCAPWVYKGGSDERSN